jgi:hypothetical protein
MLRDSHKNCGVIARRSRGNPSATVATEAWIARALTRLAMTVIRGALNKNPLRLDRSVAARAK